MTTVLPAISAALDGPVASAIGKLNGLTIANTPCGRSTERVWTAVSPRLPIGWSIPVVVLHGLGVIADQVGRLLDLAERLDPVLADLVALRRRVLELPVADELGRPTEDLDPLRHGVAAHAGCARRAAAIASSMSAGSRSANVPSRMSVVDRRARPRTSPSPSRLRRRRSSGGSRRAAPRALSRPFSNCAWSSSLSARSVAYVILMRGLASDVMSDPREAGRARRVRQV